MVIYKIILHQIYNRKGYYHFWHRTYRYADNSHATRNTYVSTKHCVVRIRAAISPWILHLRENWLDTKLFYIKFIIEKVITIFDIGRTFMPITPMQLGTLRTKHCVVRIRAAISPWILHLRENWLGTKLFYIKFTIEKVITIFDIGRTFMPITPMQLGTLCTKRCVVWRKRVFPSQYLREYCIYVKNG
jgi:hypothetical protein